ncbi:DUF4232 domain-containing protein [Kitasatospora sp. NPDC059827]|uniref:DUF4232 domain-containing protein n=1 Tax=Kitasatospora sp. NPDC059827 TaxID=3346964 RepID=UPI00366639D1
MSVRTSRTSRTRLATAAVGVVLAALSVSACTGNGDTGDLATTTGPTLRASGSASPSSAAPSSAAPAPAAPVGSAGGTGKPSAAGPASTSTKPGANAPVSKPSGGPAPEAAKPVTCTGDNTRTTAAPLNRPVNHMLLTVTNTGSGTCYLHGYPAVRFGEAQSVPPVITDSKPQAVVTLKPGESGYASVNLSSTDGTDSANGHTVNSLVVYFHGPSGNESVGAGSQPSLPAKGVYVDDSLKVTYWQQSMDDATSW